MDAPNQVQSGAASAAELRRARARALGFRFFLLVGLPTLLAGLYYGGLASDQYESVSPFTVQSADRTMATGLESLMGGLAGAGSSQDALAVREYILSRSGRDAVLAWAQEYEPVPRNDFGEYG